jgi:amino acid transporter
MARSLGYWSLALLNISAIVSLRHLPALVQMYGSSSLVFFILTAIGFFLPIAAICAELASTWPQRGGLYNWIYLPFGEFWAFMVVWWSWVAAIVNILVNLWFLALTCGYLFDIGQSPSAKLILCLGCLWGLTFLNIFGIRFSAMLTSFSVAAGIVVPMVLLSALAGHWGWAHGSASTLWPSLEMTMTAAGSLKILYFYGSMMMGYSGLEVAAFHAADASDPQKDYGRATVLSAVFIVALYILGTISLMVVIPSQEVDPIGGFSQFFTIFFNKYGIQNVAFLINLILAIGVLGAVNTWLISPAKGIFAAMEHFHFPLWLVKENRFDVPVPLIMVQAIICSFILFFLVSSHSEEQIFWILQAMTSQFSLLMYVMMTFSILRLRTLFPKQYRPIKIGRLWFWPVIFLSLISCALGMIGVFIPVEEVSARELFDYEMIFIIGFILLSLPPVFFKRRQHFVPDDNTASL